MQIDTKQMLQVPENRGLRSMTRGIDATPVAIVY